MTGHSNTGGPVEGYVHTQGTPRHPTVPGSGDGVQQAIGVHPVPLTRGKGERGGGPAGPGAQQTWRRWTSSSGSRDAEHRRITSSRSPAGAFQPPGGQYGGTDARTVGHRKGGTASGFPPPDPPHPLEKGVAGLKKKPGPLVASQVRQKRFGFKPQYAPPPNTHRDPTTRKRTGDARAWPRSCSLTDLNVESSAGCASNVPAAQRGGGVGGEVTHGEGVVGGGGCGEW